MTFKYAEKISFADARKRLQPSFDPSKDWYATVTQTPPQSSRPLPPWARRKQLPIDFKTEVEYLKYILNYCLTQLDTLDEITSENLVPRDAPSSDKTPPTPQTTLEQKKMKPQSQILSPLYNLQLQMMTKWNWVQWVTKDLSMRIAQKRNRPVLFHLRELLLVPQRVDRMALSCQKGQEGEIYQRSPLSVQTPQS